jgi:hypothetical protein
MVKTSVSDVIEFRDLVKYDSEEHPGRITSPVLFTNHPG